jgi:8-oxo-dGTP diphosphatase
MPQDPVARPVTEVAVGVLIRDDGAVLLADRPAGKPYAGYWEFPGGKVESGESVEQALVRELAEELGVTIRTSLPWVTMEYDYPHAYVRLHFRRIQEWTGAPHSAEGQQLQFHVPGDAPPAPLLPAAGPAMRWIQLPDVTGFSTGTAIVAGEAIAWMENMMGRGLRQVIWHEPLLDAADRTAVIAACGVLAAAYGARLLVDGRSLDCPASLPQGVAVGAVAGRYLDASALRACTQRPADNWLGAAVETAADLAHAARLGCDFAVFNPQETQAGALQRTVIAAHCANAPVPVYLCAESSLANLQTARSVGAHGLAMRPAAA